METRQCKECREVVPATHFYKHRLSCKRCCNAKALEWKRDNREKSAEYSRRWRARNPEKSKAVELASYYRHRDKRRNDHLRHQGINATIEDVRRMKDEQCNQCAICGDDISTKYHTDHDH